MSYFIIMSFNCEIESIKRIFKPNSSPSPFHVIDMSNTLIASIVQNGNHKWSSFVVTYGLSSEHIVDRCAPREGVSEQFRIYLDKIKEQHGAFTFLLHFFHGLIFREEIHKYSIIKSTYSDFIKIFPGIEEGILYVVSPENRHSTTNRHGRNKGCIYK